MENGKPAKPKEKRRNNEKRKEKSRDAARCRRSRETEIFSELADALPLSKETVAQLDKASIMRLAISYLKVRGVIPFLTEMNNSEPSKADDETVFLKALDGFGIVISPEGDIVYLSENVTSYLGIAQVDLMGQNIYEYSHPCDHEELRDILSSKTSTNESPSQISFFFRLKCTLTSKGRNVNLKSASYKVLHFTGHLLSPKESSEGQTVQHSLVAIGQPIPHPSNIEVPLDKKTFLSKHSLDMKFTYADEKMLEVLGYNPDDLIGQPMYEYYHAMDSDVICSGFKCLFAKGQCETTMYRFLAKYGGFVWVVSQATVLYDKHRKPQNVVCVHHVVSGIECKDDIYSIAQLNAQQLRPEGEQITISSAPATSIITLEQDLKDIVLTENNNTDIIPIPTVIFETESDITDDVQDVITADKPQSATSKIFAPRTEEMNKGYLMFSEEEPGLTILKDEPDDLTHLAPTAGDVCVPLADNPFLSEMFDDFILSDNYCTLLPDDMHSLDSQSSKTSGGRVVDPFMVYQDDYDFCKSELSNSPQLMSPSLSQSPKLCSVPSLGSPGNSLSDDDNISTFMSLQMDTDGEPEILSKSPYISLGVGEDLPLLMSEDLMWGALPDEKLTQSNSALNSSLAQLLCQKNVPPRSFKSNDHGGGLVNPSEVMGQIFGNNKGVTKLWGLQETTTTHQLNKSSSELSVNKSSKFSNERAQKRLCSNNNAYESLSKRCRGEPKEKLSSELLNQLMSNNNTIPRSQTKVKSDWINRRADIGQHQPSDSVLMNLLDCNSISSPISVPLPTPMEDIVQTLPNISVLLGNRSPTIQIADNCHRQRQRRELIRKNSFSLLDPESRTIPSLMDLSEQDYDVNAPVNSVLLQGYELLNALEASNA